MTFLTQMKEIVLIPHLVEVAGQGNGIRDDLLRVAMLDQGVELCLAFLCEPLAGSVIAHWTLHS